MKNKRIKWKLLLITILLIFLLVILSIVINRENISSIYNTYIKKLNSQNEDDIISIDVSIKATQDDITKCLLTFKSNDESEKIKSIEYPGEEQNTIVVNDEQGKKTIAIDYDLEAGKEDSKFKITTTEERVIEKRTGYTIHYNLNAEDAHIDNNTKSQIVNKNTKINDIPTRDGYTFFGWSKNADSKVSEYEEEEYVYQEGDRDINLYAIWIENILANSIIKGAEQIEETNYKSINVNNEAYIVNAIVYNGDLILDGNIEIQDSTLNNNVYEFGNKFVDVAKKDKYARSMVILKVKGNLTINEGVTLTVCKSDDGYGGPKGLLIYCTGTLTNKGTISMTARGAYAKGQNVYLWQNEDGNYEYVPEIGANGGASYRVGRYTTRDGNRGNDGTNRSTGGGGTGSGRSYFNGFSVGTGGRGTSYSGGSGSGAANDDGQEGRFASSQNASLEGGFGSNGVVMSGNSSGYGQISMGGTGNPSGTYANYRVMPISYIKREGTGGLLTIYSNKIINNGKIEANGVSSSTANRSFAYARIDTGGASRRRKCKYIL